MSNNFMQLFFGWEAVGLVSYLLIGFWFTRPTAIYANLKAFLVNRVGDFGFLLGIGMVLYYFGSLDYATVFQRAPGLAETQVNLLGSCNWSLMTVTCLLLFVGAMGKSAQVPLHVWLPDSMEGPTPISALIHAATMVTAGIFMVARMSPLYELSTTALSTVMVIGAITALFMGFLGIIQNDIKRVVAYSTLSQLGYMTVALGASAYSVAIFHLMTHAFFKALLFLGAGSVIMGMHHDQDIRNMGNLKKYMPVTWITSLIGSLALIGTPFFAGFYSKDSIIEAVELSHIPGSGFAYFAVIVGVFVTAFYSFRLYFLVFLLLAIPSVLIGYFTIEPMLLGSFLADAITVNPALHPAMTQFAAVFHGPLAMAQHALSTPPLYLAAAGAVCAWYMYLVNPAVPAAIGRALRPLVVVLENKYYMDWINENILAKAARGIGVGLWQGGDRGLIEGAVVNLSWKIVGFVSGIVRRAQTGFLYHYAFVMIAGLLAFMTYFVWLAK